MIVPPGVSGRPALYRGNVDNETLSNEVSLLNLGNFEPLKFHIDTGKYMHEISQFNNDWVDYLPRADRPNNRKALTVTNMLGKTHMDLPSLAEVSYSLNRKVSELEFNQPTDVYKQCASLHELIDYWQPVGRTVLLNLGVGGYFAPHRDHPSMPREVFRIIVFLNNCGPLQFDWLQDDKKLAIQQGQAYYVNTRLTHRTMAWANDCHHLIMNIPFNTGNIIKLIGNLAHTH